jgi:hypothetical protein
MFRVWDADLTYVEEHDAQVTRSVELAAVRAEDGCELLLPDDKVHEL